MQLNANQARVIAVNADVLMTLGVKRCVITHCEECGIPVLAERAGYLIVCGYCGADTQLAAPELIPFWRRVIDRWRPVRATVRA
jgi:uncharacterized Zn finger protein (UPF0148 family)